MTNTLTQVASSATLTCVLRERAGILSASSPQSSSSSSSFSSSAVFGLAGTSDRSEMQLPRGSLCTSDQRNGRGRRRRLGEVDALRPSRPLPLGHERGDELDVMLGADRQKSGQVGRTTTSCGKDLRTLRKKLLKPTRCHDKPLTGSCLPNVLKRMDSPSLSVNDGSRRQRLRPPLLRSRLLRRARTRISPSPRSENRTRTRPDHPG
jgi:hypothetical protein